MCMCVKLSRNQLPKVELYRLENLRTIGTCVSILMDAYVYMCQIVSKSSAQSQIVSRSVGLSVGFTCKCYSLLHLECHVISISNLNLLGLFSTERGKRDLKN